MNIESKPTPSELSWATLTLEIKSAPNSSSEIADIEVRLDNLAGLLAEEAEIEGVETRDTSTCELAPLSSVSDPNTSKAIPTTERNPAPCSQFANLLPLDGKSLAIIVYTAPHALERIETLALQLAKSMDLDVVANQAIHRDDNWRDYWKTFYQPIHVAQGRLVIRPTWLEPTNKDQILELVLDPGRAFGTGLHETTRLCLEMMGVPENLLPNSQSSSSKILDLGCGSGILGLAYTKLYEDTIGRCDLVDVDSEAVAAALENTQANGLESKVSTQTGTIEQLPSETYDLVFANIRSETLINSAKDICQRLRPGGIIYLSGILIEEADEVCSAFTNAGLDWIASQTMADWCAIKMQKAIP